MLPQGRPITYGCFENKKDVRVVMSVKCFTGITKVLRAVRASEPLAVNLGYTAITQRVVVHQGFEVF